MRDHTLSVLCNRVLSPWQYRTFCALSTYYLYVQLGTSLTFLLGLLSAVLIAVAFRHLATKSSFYFTCFYFYLACRLAAIVFAAWVAVPFFASSRHFYCHAIFIAAVHFIAAQPALSRLFMQGWTFLLLSCRFCAGPVVAMFILLLKTFHCDYRLLPCFFFFFFIFFFFLLVVVLLVIFMPSFCSYCHCSTGSNSYTVVLSKPASYSSALFSPHKRRGHGYQLFVVAYGTGKVRQLQYVSGCCKRTYD